MSNNPYTDFFEKKQNNETEQPSAQMLEHDRGEAQIKIEEKRTGLDKNTIIAIGVIIVALLIVVVFIFILISRIGGGEKTELLDIDNQVLQKQEVESLGDIKNRLDAQMAAEEEARKRAELARLAEEEARRQAELQEPPKEQPKEQSAGPSLGVLEGQEASTVPLSQRDPAELTPEELAHLRKQRGAVLAYQSPSSTTSAGSSQSQLERPSSLGNQLITERHADGYATLRKNRKYLLPAGTNIPCTILPRVITNYFSQPTCIVNEDIYSVEGIVLIDRGSKVLGEQRTAIQRGSKRVFIAWADVETPEGVSIKIDSMAADSLGGAGVDAWVDNHWRERFGAAILLSFVDDLFEVIAAEMSKNQQNWENSTNNANSMAQIALENSIHIQPTGYIMPAKQVHIIVARDIDFTNIYTVR